MTAFNVEGGLVTEEPLRLTGNTATIVYTAVGRTTIASIFVCPTNGTPTITIEIYNAAGASVMFRRKAVTPTAGTPVIDNEPFILEPGYTIRVTSGSASGEMDVMVTRGIGTAPGMLRPV